MWDTVTPKSNCSWEPVELRILKQELANMVCKCHACETSRNPIIQYRELDQCNEAGTQVDQKNFLLNQYIYANSDIPPGVDELLPNKTDCLRKDIFCPNCYFIWDLLRRVKQVFKDEESETKPESTDKATGKTVKFVDSSNSVIKLSDTPEKVLSSNLTLCDFLSDCSSNSLNTTQSNIRKDHAVMFLEDFPHVDASKIKPTMHGNCFCLENYIDSIRPPFKHVCNK